MTGGTDGKSERSQSGPAFILRRLTGSPFRTIPLSVIPLLHHGEATVD
jgi:hypothetical protein